MFQCQPACGPWHGGTVLDTANGGYSSGSLKKN
eukprot:COSAG01_NODE_914_length_12771_cov_47.345802_7_plen_33_part_00